MLDTPTAPTPAQVPALSLSDEAADPVAVGAALGGAFGRCGFALG
ncbi:MAG: hypothetical protein ACJAWY_002524, partial [Sphingomonas echinoides]